MRLLLTLIFSVLASPLLAQDVSPEEADETARLHFRAGQSHYAAGRFLEAVREFEASYAISAHAELQHNIYLAHRDAGDRERAAAALRRYLDEAESVPNRSLLEARLQALERDEPEPPDPEPADVVDGPSMVPGAVLIGAGAALGLGAVITGIRALDAQDRLQERCPTRRCAPEDESLEDEARRNGRATDVLWPVASAVAIVGLVLVIRAAVSDDTDAAVSCTGDGCHAVVRGRF